jgi:hypothetical protein
MKTVNRVATAMILLLGLMIICGCSSVKEPLIVLTGREVVAMIVFGVIVAVAVIYTFAAWLTKVFKR